MLPHFLGLSEMLTDTVMPEYKKYRWNFGEVDVAPAKNDKVNKVEK